MYAQNFKIKYGNTVHKMKTFTKTISFFLAAVILLITIPSTFAFAVDDPEISDCAAALVYCVESGTVLWSRNADAILYPARLVKLMTAILAVEKFGDDIDRVCTASDTAIQAANEAQGITVGFEVGEKISLRELIEVMIHTGANDAAYIIAEEVSGSTEEFVAEMNRKAKELGMTKTVFNNPTGIHSSNNVTTASDMLRLAVYCSASQTLLDICSMIRVTISKTNKRKERSYGTTNYLLSQNVYRDYYLDTANGMICGSTDEAGLCAISSAQYNGLNFIAVVLGAKEETVLNTPENTVIDKNGNKVNVPATYKPVYNNLLDCASLLKWSYANFSYVTAAGPSTPICQIDVNLAKDVDKVVLLPEKEIEIFVPNDIDVKKDIILSYDLKSDSINAPVKAGTEMGTLTVSYNGQILGEVPLVIMNNIEQSTGLRFLEKVKDLCSTPIFKILIVSLIIAAVIYVISTSISRGNKKKAEKRRKQRSTKYLNR